MSRQILPDPKTVKNFPHSNRKARIVNDRGRLRVVERLYYWDKEAGRGKEKRLYIGYVVGNEYFTNEQYDTTISAMAQDASLPNRRAALLMANQPCQWISLPRLKPGRLVNFHSTTP